MLYLVFFLMLNEVFWYTYVRRPVYYVFNFMIYKNQNPFAQ